MNDPDWAKVMNHLYESQGTVFLSDIEGDEDHTYEELYDLLHAEVGFSEEITNHRETSDMVHNMQEVGLIDYEVQQNGCKIDLTEKGFDVAHEREMNRNQQMTNIGIGILTAFLVIGSLLQGYSAYLSHSNPSDQLALLSIVAIGGLAGFMVVGLMTGQSVWESIRNLGKS